MGQSMGDSSRLWSDIRWAMVCGLHSDVLVLLGTSVFAALPLTPGGRTCAKQSYVLHETEA